MSLQPMTRRALGRLLYAAALTAVGPRPQASATRTARSPAGPYSWYRDFPALDQRINGHAVTYLDSAATTQRPTAVLDALLDYYRRDNANPGRQLHTLARRADERYESARQTVARFINARSSEEIVWVRGTTEAINVVASAWVPANIHPGDEILVTVAEHASNLLPWRLASERTGASLRFVDVDDEGRIDLADLDRKLSGHTRLVAFSHVSNVIGYVNPAAAVCARARRAGARVLAINRLHELQESTPMNRLVTWTVSLAATVMTVPVGATEIDWAKVDQAIGKKGVALPGAVHKFSFPRSDLKVTVDGVAIKPALALGSWVVFQTAPDGAMFMGDLVLTDTEISPVMMRLIDDGVEITAVHNHLLRTSLPVFYMHVGGHGDPVKFAQAIHAAIALSQTPLSPGAAAQPASLELDTAAIDKTLGYKGSANGGVYQFSVPRGESISEGGMPVPPSMGTATAINFQPTGGSKAAVTGDFVLLGTEVNPILRTLRQHGIEVTALHSHMIEDSPPVFFMHFWANDNAAKLAEGLRAALDLANVRRDP